MLAMPAEAAWIEEFRPQAILALDLLGGVAKHPPR